MEDRFLLKAKELIDACNGRQDTISHVVEFLQQVYDWGVLDERFGDWEAPEEIKAEVVIKDEHQSPQTGAYKPMLNEFTKITFRK